ncbi:MAG: dephospho-CoA kinase [Burkholderiales bacterium]|nr:dephospho-CoA kinase [Burkholderiales bacterium]
MNAAKRTLIGLTGGIGSGKSTVAAMLADLGAHVLDADHIARTITLPGGAAMAAIEQAFGNGMIAPDGSLNREAMRAAVFKDPIAKQRLEHITHPLIAQALSNAISSAPTGAVVLDVPLLVESDRWRKQLAAVVVVDCTVQTQHDRVTQRNAWPSETTQSIIRSQASRAQRLAAADAVLLNEGVTLTDLRGQVLLLASRLGI